MRLTRIVAVALLVGLGPVSLGAPPGLAQPKGGDETSQNARDTKLPKSLMVPPGAGDGFQGRGREITKLWDAGATVENAISTRPRREPSTRS